MNSVYEFTCEACGLRILGEMHCNDVLMLICGDCDKKLNQPTRLDGCVTAGSWQSIVDAHMQGHDQWRSRMVQLAKDICGGAT